MTDRSHETKKIDFDEGKGLSTEQQQYDPTPIIDIRPFFCQIEADFAAKVESHFNEMIDHAMRGKS